MMSRNSHNFQEYIVGMQLCSEGILSRRRTFHFNSQDSLTISCKNEDVTLQLPPEILDYPKPSLEVAFSLFGPVGVHFKFPKGMIPVSPAVWLCFSPRKEFHHPATLKLPHCFESESQGDSMSLFCLKAEEKDITRDGSGQTLIKFNKSSSKFLANSQYSIINAHHFCIYCLVVEDYSSEGRVVGKINYCMTILKPKLYPTDKNLRIYCILHFNLRDCKRVR